MNQTVRIDSLSGRSVHLDDAVAMLEELHKLSLSDKPQEACTGRAGKHMLGALDAWLTEEKARRTESSVMMTATMSTAVSALLTVFASVVRPEAYGEMAPDIVRIFATAFFDGLKNHIGLTKQQSEANK